MSLKDPIYLKKTYCNPLAIPNYPRGVEGAAWDPVMTYTGEPEAEYRSMSDPSLLFYDNKWYLYPSYGMTYVSEDFVNWKFVPTEPSFVGYSPSVIPWGNSFIMTSHSHGLYTGDSPTGPFAYEGDFIMADGTEVRPVDSALFLDDDGRMYLYYFEMQGDMENFHAYSMGVELDRENPRKFVGDPVMINEFNPDNWWERFGAYNQNKKYGWIEGQWMVKHNGRYYFIYAAPATEHKSYCMAAYYSDEGPLSGFVCQKNNPITYSPFGIVSGAGHGCIDHGPNNTLWAFYTITHCALHPWERRVGMDPIYVDENGELYCPRVSQTPQLGYGEFNGPEEDNDTGLLPLTFLQRQNVKASSAAPGRGAIYAFDESILTWWEPADDDETPTLYMDTASEYVCEAMRIMWRELNINYEEGTIPGPYRYVVEGRLDMTKDEWTTLVDMSENREDFVVDYRTFPPTICREFRLRILGAPKGIKLGVTSFTVFGTSEI